MTFVVVATFNTTPDHGCLKSATRVLTLQTFKRRESLGTGEETEFQTLVSEGLIEPGDRTPAPTNNDKLYPDVGVTSVSRRPCTPWLCFWTGTGQGSD